MHVPLMLFSMSGRIPVIVSNVFQFSEEDFKRETIESGTIEPEKKNALHLSIFEKYVGSTQCHVNKIS